MGFAIRAMRMEDYDGVLSLWQATEGIGPSPDDSREGIERYLTRNPGMSFVAEADGEIIGAVLCGHDGRRGCLHHMAVAAEHRRRGIGGRLVERCMGALRDVGIAKCNLFLFAENELGAAFWEAMGWRRRSDLFLIQRMVAGET